MKISAKFKGVPEFRRRLRKLSVELRGEITAEVKKSAQAVERAIDGRAPLPAIAAATTVNVSRDGLTATVGLHGKRANRKGFLARIFEFGAKAHEILPRGERKRAKRLRAKFGGRLPVEKARVLVTNDGRFLGKRVRHPGMAARPFFFNTAKALSPQIAAAIKAAILRALEKSR